MSELRGALFTRCGYWTVLLTTFVGMLSSPVLV